MASSKVTFKWNPGWEKQLERQIRDSPLQQRLNSEVQAIVRGVNSEMKGDDVAKIHRELIARISAYGAEPNIENLRTMAQAIADGEMV